MSGESCGTCRFFQPPSIMKWADGTCRRFPPTTTSYTGQAHRDGYPVPGVLESWSGAGQPSANPGNWCGEWKGATP